MVAHPEKTNHTTEDEINFIKNIGTFSNIGKRRPQKYLLEKYLEGCLKRKDWCNLDRVAIILFAEDELGKIK